MKKSSKNIQNSSKKGGTAAKKVQNNKDQKKLGTKGITLIVVSSVLLAVLVAGIIIIAVNYMKQKEEENFEYIESDLTKYLTIENTSYKDYTVNLNIAKPKEKDVDVTLLNLLASKKGSALNDASAQLSGTIGAGDIVNIYYRGYTRDKDGNEVFVDNMCNFGNKNDSGVYTYSSLEIGSNSFLPGFELDLAGETFSSKNNFVMIKDGLVKDGQIVYISYTRQLDGSTASNDKIEKSAERIIIADGKDKIDAKYGAGFYDKLITLTVGSTATDTVEGTVDGKKYNYTNLKIDFATECEKKDNYILVECYFPYDYKLDPNLRNKTAYFEVYVQSMVDYESEELTNEFIEENLTDKDFGVTAEDLEKHKDEGDRVAQLRAYIKNLLDEDYKELYRKELEKAMWEHYHKEGIANVIKYPQVKVNAIFNEYYDDVLYQFEQSGGVIKTLLGEEKTCKTVDEYAVIYLGLEYAENQDWRAYLTSLSENLVKERLILFYIMKEENLMPSAEVLAARKQEVEKEYFDEYIYQYSEKYGINKSDYTDEKWAEFEAERYKELHDYYDDAYFTEITYYEIGLDTFLSWPSVTTLDGVSQ